MVFKITRGLESGFSVIRLHDDAGTAVTVVPAFGALLHAFVCMHQGQPLNVIDSYSNEQELRQQLTSSFKGVKLSPFACRIRNSTFAYNGEHYTVQKSSIHGLLFDQSFEVIHEVADEEAASVTLRHDYTGTDAGFPFTYTCEVTYHLSAGNTLKINTILRNNGSTPMPVMDGWHPYFTTGSPVDRLQLQFYSSRIVQFDEKLLPTGKTLPYDEFRHNRSMNGVFLDNSFLLDFSQPAPLCTIIDPEKNIRIAFYPEASYPVLQVYTPPHRQSIAVENLSGVPDAFNNGIGLVEIAAGGQKYFSITIRVAV